MTIPRQLAPTVGLAHGGVEFLKGFHLGIEKFASGRRKDQFFEGICINFKFTELRLEILRAVTISSVNKIIRENPEDLA